MLKRSLLLISVALLCSIPRAHSQSHGDAPPPTPTRNRLHTETPRLFQSLLGCQARQTNPSLDEVFDAILAATWKSQHGAGYSGEIANVVDNVVLYDLMALAANDHAGNEVRAIASLKLHQLKEWLAAPDAVRLAGSEAYIFFAAKQIEQFEKDPKRLDLTPPAEPPAGPPIGELGLEDEYMFAISGRSPER
jgi:hypothetical protein